ncbi:MAG: hypothetical protein RIT45_635 [Pseudomonadota bacterium]
MADAERRFDMADRVAWLALAFCALSLPFALLQGEWVAVLGNLTMVGSSLWYLRPRANNQNARILPLLVGAFASVLLELAVLPAELGVHHWLLPLAALPFALLDKDQLAAGRWLSGGAVAAMALFSARSEPWDAHSWSRIAADTLASASVAVLAQEARRSAERAHESVRAERERARAVLFDALPAPVASRLVRNPTNFIYPVNNATVIFADIVGFTALSERLEGQRLVAALEAVFSAFDAITQRHGGEKIKTIGDAYMATVNVLHDASDHCERATRIGLEMVDVLRSISAEQGLGVDLRVGVHSGPLRAGVLGRERIAFDVWGRTVNIASRIETRAAAGQVLVSDTTALQLGGSFVCEPVGPYALKGIASPIYCYQVSAASADAAAHTALAIWRSIPEVRDELRDPTNHLAPVPAHLREANLTVPSKIRREARHLNY